MAAGRAAGGGVGAGWPGAGAAAGPAGGASLMQLQLIDMTVGVGDLRVLDGLDLTLGTGEIGCLLGASGCGKTTALRAIAGFEPLRQGAIRIGDRQVSAPGVTVAPQERRVGMVFQDYALFPHLNAADNIGFGLRDWKAA